MNRPGLYALVATLLLLFIGHRGRNQTVSSGVAVPDSPNVARQRTDTAYYDGTVYIVDGVQMKGAAGVNLPPNAIEEMNIITSGVPGKYVDSTGGIISITPRIPSANTKYEQLDK